ncbi:meiosis-specific coiled-coil domain-containing protein MEIOC [Rhinophrynus dorsalis]
MIPNMDNPLLSPFVNRFPSAGPPPQSRLYSSWSVCEDEAVPTSVPECSDKNGLFTFPDSRLRPDMYGLVSGISEEQNKIDPVTDWDSLSRLFPPLWASHVGDQRQVSDSIPNSIPESGDLSHMMNAQTSREQTRNLPDMESLQRGFEDLGLLESWVSHPESCNPELEDLLKDVYIENPALRLNSALQQIEGPNQSIGDYVRFKSKDYGTNCNSIYSNLPKRGKEYHGVDKQMWKGDKGRGKFLKNNAVNQSNSSFSPRDAWCKEKYPKTQDYMSLKTQLGVKPSTYHYNQQFQKERGFQTATPWKSYSEVADSSYSSFPKVGNFECYDKPTRQSPTECSTKTPDYDSPGKAINLNENIHISSKGHRWLDGEMLGTQKQAASPLPSPVSSNFSDGSPTHHSLSQPSYFSHTSPVPPSGKDGHTQMNSNSGFSNFIDETQRPGKPFGHTSPSKDGGYRNMPLGFSPTWPNQQQNFGLNNAERYPRLPKKQNPQNNGSTDRRGRRNWNAPQGNPRQAPQQYNGFQRKQDPNVGNVSDFINASFLPSFPVMSDLKQNHNFPSFNPQTFSPPGNIPFPPPPFPFSDLIDLFHYEDLNHLNPFISDLFCGDISSPYLPFPTPFNRYRPPRNRSGPANELHVQLEECCEQWRALEKERKKTEADLARSFPGNRVSSSYSSTVPRLPANPSRVDRLIVDQLREHSRALSLIKIMERICCAALHVNISLALEQHLEAIHLTQARRKDEIVNVANRQKQGAPRYNNEKDVLALAAAIKEMVASTRKARTALWCALQMTLPKSLCGTTVRQEDVERALLELCPTKPTSLDAEICADKQESKKEQEPFQSSN